MSSLLELLSSDKDNNLIIENELLETTAVQELAGAESLTDDNAKDDVTAAVCAAAVTSVTAGESFLCSLDTAIGSEDTARTVSSVRSSLSSS